MSLFLHVTDREAAWREALGRRLPGSELVGVDASPEQLARVRYALVWKLGHGQLAAMPGLEAVFVLGAGVDWVLGDPSLPVGVPVIRLEDAGMAAQLVDYHLYAALHFQRDFDHYGRDQAAGRWQPRRPGARLRVSVLGLGGLGEAVARGLIGRGFPVRGWTRRPRAVEGVRVDAGLEALPGVLAQTDLLVSLLPHTAATAGLLDRRRLLTLPVGAAIVNAGRGSLIDEGALVELLDAGHLRGAFLDVMGQEPLPASSRLWSHPGVRLTPHVAAATVIEPAVEQIADNIARIERGEAPRGCVDVDAGY